MKNSATLSNYISYLVLKNWMSEEPGEHMFDSHINLYKAIQFPATLTGNKAERMQM